MRNISKKINKIAVMGLLVGMMIMLVTPSGYAYPGVEQNKTFIFTDTGVEITIPDTYKLYKTITMTDFQGNVVAEPQDIFITKDNRIFVLDMSNGRVFIYRPDYTLEKIIDKFVLENGETTSLNKPEGLFVAKDNTIYIADTNNQRILHINEEGQVLFITNKPDSFMGTAMETFYPTKVVADSVGRITVVARNINMGLLQFDMEGHFTGYTGAPEVKVNPIAKLWKQFFSSEQKAKSVQFVPTEYSNIIIDDGDFIYGTISSLALADILTEIGSWENPGDATPIRKLNSLGEDILKRNGFFSPVGNIFITTAIDVSRMVDVALGPAGSYTLLDNNKNILYTYSDEGVLLHAFGGSGKSKESFERPVAIDYQGNNILVLDALLSQIMVFTPTTYYQTVIEAITSEYTGDFSIAYQKWSDIATMNANFLYAYTGLGEIRMSEENYPEAMEYFRYASDLGNYSKAKEKQRQNYMATAFPIIFISLAVIVVLVFIIGRTKKIRNYFEGRMKHGREAND